MRKGNHDKSLYTHGRGGAKFNLLSCSKFCPFPQATLFGVVMSSSGEDRYPDICLGKTSVLNPQLDDGEFTTRT